MRKLSAKKAGPGPLAELELPLRTKRPRVRPSARRPPRRRSAAGVRPTIRIGGTGAPAFQPPLVGGLRPPLSAGVVPPVQPKPLQPPRMQPPRMQPPKPVQQPPVRPKPVRSKPVRPPGGASRQPPVPPSLLPRVHKPAGRPDGAGTVAPPPLPSRAPQSGGSREADASAVCAARSSAEPLASQIPAACPPCAPGGLGPAPYTSGSPEAASSYAPSAGAQARAAPQSWARPPLGAADPPSHPAQTARSWRSQAAAPARCAHPPRPPGPTPEGCRPAWPGCRARVA